VHFLEGLGGEAILEMPVRTAEGGEVDPERDVPGVEGWCGSRPVRVGNAAGMQLQFDALGFVLDAVFSYRRLRRRLGARLGSITTALADRVSAVPAGEPSNGIWEIREP